MSIRGSLPTTVVIPAASIVIVVILCTLFVVSVQNAHQATLRVTCTSNLKMIGQALHRYVQDYGCFPPPYLVDDAGKPMHSWRILILPYLDGQDLYGRYNWSEPWNSAHNRQLAKFMPEVYRCPAAPAGTATTSYVAVLGPHTPWRVAGGMTYSGVKDISTIMVVEVADSGISWMEPRDLAYNQALLGVNNATTVGISSHHTSFANCLFMDGSVHSLGNRISAQLLADLLRIDVGNKTEDSTEPINGSR